jgi:hypothetical protein
MADRAVPDASFDHVEDAAYDLRGFCVDGPDLVLAIVWVGDRSIAVRTSPARLAAACAFTKRAMHHLAELTHVVRVD